MTISTSNTVCVRDEQVHTTLENECVILSLSNSVYYGLDPVGTLVWESLQVPVVVSVLVDSVLEEYDVARAECELDTLALLERLKDEQLIQVLPHKD